MDASAQAGLLQVALDCIPENVRAQVEPAARVIVQEISMDYWIGALPPMDAIRLVQHRVNRLVDTFA